MTMEQVKLFDTEIVEMTNSGLEVPKNILVDTINGTFSNFPECEVKTKHADYRILRAPTPIDMSGGTLEVDTSSLNCDNIIVDKIISKADPEKKAAFISEFQKKKAIQHPLAKERIPRILTTILRSDIKEIQATNTDGFLAWHVNSLKKIDLYNVKEIKVAFNPDLEELNVTNFEQVISCQITDVPKLKDNDIKFLPIKCADGSENMIMTDGKRVVVGYFAGTAEEVVNALYDRANDEDNHYNNITIALHNNLEAIDTMNANKFEDMAVVAKALNVPVPGYKK